MSASTPLPRPLRAALLLVGLAGAAQAEDAPSIAWPEPGGRATISRVFNGSPITVGVSSRTGGAIDSLTWGGTEFINAHDHGREKSRALAMARAVTSAAAAQSFTKFTWASVRPVARA